MNLAIVDDCRVFLATVILKESSLGLLAISFPISITWMKTSNSTSRWDHRLVCLSWCWCSNPFRNWLVLELSSAIPYCKPLLLALITNPLVYTNKFIDLSINSNFLINFKILKYDVFSYTTTVKINSGIDWVCKQINNYYWD